MRRPRGEHAPLRRRGLLLVPRLLPLRVPGAPHLHLRARHLRLRGGRREPGQQQAVPPSKCLWVGGHSWKKVRGIVNYYQKHCRPKI